MQKFTAITLEIPIITLDTKEETTVTETVYNIDDFPYTKYRQAERIAKKGISYYNMSTSFDIESTTIDGIKDDKDRYVVNPQGFMYHWQFCVKDTVCFGRTWEEFITFMKRLKYGLDLSEKKQLIVYIHNLAYEFQFIKDFFQIKSMFARDKRKVMKFNSTCYEFRCSYFLSNMSLSKFCENSKLCYHYKLVDSYNYRILRTPNTPMTNNDLAYCYNDVRGLCECIDTLLLEDDILSLPLTNTGYVRREFRQKMRTRENRRIFEKTALSVDEYQMLRRAFRGGNTHASRFYSNKVLDDVHSYDIQSSYPAVMVTDDFPIGKFTKVTLDTQEKLNKYCNEFCTVMDIEIFNIEVKENISIPYVDIAHCTKQSNIVNDNGRVLKADYIQLTLTNVDLNIIRDTYNFDGLRVLNAMYARRGKLPKEFRQTVMEFYKLKTELKGVDDKEYEYMKSKNRVNSSYGMTVTAIDHSEIMYDSHEWFETLPDLEAALEKYYKSRNNFLSYQWGVFVTANARNHLQQLLNKVNDDVIYTDTDSIKFINESNKQYFEDANKQLIEIALNNDIPAYATDKKGIKRFLGIWDCETEGNKIYKRFKTLGAKKYCYEQLNKKNELEFHVTVSGMSKSKGAVAVNNIENFTIGRTFEDVGRTVSWYNESEVKTVTINNDTFTTASNIAILDSTYTLGITNEYFEILENYVDNISDMYYN
jgi:hypothetical protein